MQIPEKLTIQAIVGIITKQISIWSKNKSINLDLKEQIQICAEIIRLENNYSPLETLLETLEWDEGGKIMTMGGIKITIAMIGSPFPKKLTFPTFSLQGGNPWFEKSLPRVSSPQHKEENR